MAYAKSSLIQDIRHLLQDNPWEASSTTTTTSATVAVPDGTKWAAGDIGEWSFSGTVGGEQFLVTSVSGNNLTTVRGYNGTTSETHSSGDRVVKNPRYTVIQITDAIDRVIDGLYPTAWTVTSTNITPSSTATWFDSGLSAANALALIDMQSAVQRYGPSNDKLGYYGASKAGVRMLPIQFVRDAPTALLTSGVGVRFPGRFHHTSNVVAVSWRVKITNTVSGGNYSDIDEGLLTEAIANGVCARLVEAKDIPNVSEEARLGQESPGAFLSIGSFFEQKYLELLAQYHLDLRNRIPQMPDQDYVPGWW